MRMHVLGVLIAAADRDRERTCELWVKYTGREFRSSQTSLPRSSFTAVRLHRMPKAYWVYECRLL